MSIHVCTHVEHDSSTTLVRDGKLESHIMEERLCHNKNATYPLLSIKKLHDEKIYTENISFSTLCEYNGYLDCIHQIGIRTKVWNAGSMVTHKSHHSLHAIAAFIRSGLDESIIVIVDGAGTKYPYGKEHLTIFVGRYDETGTPLITPIHQKCLGPGGYIAKDVPRPEFVDPYFSIGPGFAYAAIACACGWQTLECGKVMGLAPYGKPDKNMPELLNKFTGANPDVFSLMNSDDAFGARGAYADKNDYIRSIYEGNDLSPEYASKAKTITQNLCWRIQDDFEKYLINLFNGIAKKSSIKNIVYSGGCALNCVANYKILKSLPEDVNLYVEPISGDDGVSIGGALSSLISSGEKIDKESFKGIYLGSHLEYDYVLSEGETHKDVTAKEVASLISEGNIVAIAQGRSESGPRALGNRSILFDPRVSNGKDIVNRVKQREYFRPFAGTVLKEHAKEWFDMDKLDESPYMMYAVDVIPEQQNKIPSIVHVDGTCRIQTVTEEQNKNYYELINEFYSLTDVPIIFNTSFNLAGDTMVETIDDAFDTLRKSEIEYLYLPEIKKLIHVPNK